MRLIQTASNLILILALFSLALACGGGGGGSTSANARNGDAVTVRFKLSENDDIFVYDLNGTFENPGEPITTSKYDPVNRTATIEIDPIQSYRIRLKSNGIEFIEFIILKTDFDNAVDNRLDMGEMNGATTYFSSLAFKNSASSSKARGKSVDVESALQNLFNTINNANIDTDGNKLAAITSLREMTLSKVQNIAGISPTQKAMINMYSLSIKRITKAQEQGVTIDQNLWDNMVDVLVDMNKEAEANPNNNNIMQKYIQNFNTGNSPLAQVKLDKTDLDSFFIGSESSLDDFLNVAQSDNPNEQIFLSQILSFEEYAVIDISGGPNATNYPVTFQDTLPASINNAGQRKNQIVLRQISGGPLTMGSLPTELGRDGDETQHNVELTKNYYIGVFEITQGQYQQITGLTPSTSTGESRPVENVSWNEARGGNNSSPSNTSFIGILKSKTENLGFDLPTEAEWEFACRGTGVNSALSNGTNLSDTNKDSNLDSLGRYVENGGLTNEHANVKSFNGNAFGLFDMHGNVSEWVRDWYAPFSAASSVNPTGPASGESKTVRGGSWIQFAKDCRSASRASGGTPDSKNGTIGFRIILIRD